MKALSILAAPVMLVALGQGASAMGEGFVRTLKSSSVGDCSNGVLKEHYYNSGNMRGGSEQIEIVCFSDIITARWVFIAETHCEGIKVCNKVKPPKRPFASPAGHWIESQPSGHDSPAVMTYNVPRYAIGYNCPIRSYDFTMNPDEQSGSGGKTFYWACARYEAPFFEGLRDAITVGTSAQKADTEDESMPFQVTLSAQSYSYDQALEIIDP